MDQTPVENVVHVEFLTLEELRESVSLTNAQVNDLVHNHQKFVAVLQKLNSEAKAKIMSEKPREGLVYLGEAEKILQYGASCGKNLDRNMIICILHNEACCYQRLWELEKCSNYIEALIFNISSHLKTSTPSPFEAEQYMKTSTSLSTNHRCPHGKFISHRIQLAKYHLQYCAINSQLRNHQDSLTSAKRSISIMKGILSQLKTLINERRLLESHYGSASLLPEEPQSEYLTKLKILSGVSSISEQFHPAKLKDYAATAQYYIQRWSVRKLDQTNEQLKEGLKTFSIGHVMQIKTLDLQDNQLDPTDKAGVMAEDKTPDDVLRFFNLSRITHHVILLTIGYFTAATELRLIATNLHKDEDAKKNSKQFIQSEIFHLVAIIITSIYIPYDMVYMRHLLTSFSNHYNSKITDSQESIEGEVLKKQFDVMELSETKRNSVISNNPKYSTKEINSCLAHEFAESIRTSSKIQPLKKSNMIGERCSPTPRSSKKSFKGSRQSVSNKLKTSTEKKARILSEDDGVVPEETNINKVHDNQKHKSKTRKTRKSSSNNSKKSRDNKKSKTHEKKDKSWQRPKQEYYRSSLKETISPVRKKVEKPDGKLTHDKSKGKAGGMMGSKFLVGKDKKMTPLKKNLDKYYF